MIRWEEVTVAYGGAPVLDAVSLQAPIGALLAIVGPSGAGKSTLLRLVNRLVAPSRGRVWVRGEDVAALDPVRLRRSIGYAIQSVGLFPHRTVAQNIATVPRLLGWPRARIQERVEALIDLVRLDPSLMARRPSELSGGQAQRVGLARALAGDPDLLLMDEPFGAVDPITRRTLRGELRRIHAATGKTILLVTHDPDEALELATHLAVLRDGRVVAAGPVEAAATADPFVRDLLGGRAIAMRRLERDPVASLLDPRLRPDAPAVAPDASLAEALALMIERRADAVSVEADGAPLGSVALADLVERHP